MAPIAVRWSFAACAAGAEVTILSDGALDAGALDAGVHVEVIAEEETRFQHLSDTVDAFVGFPAGIATVRALFNVWVLAGGGLERQTGGAAQPQPRL